MDMQRKSNRECYRKVIIKVNMYKLYWNLTPPAADAV